jgi:hypothetical protein
MATQQYKGALPPRDEVDRSRASSAEGKNSWSYTSTPQDVFMMWCLIKNSDNFIIILLWIYIPLLDLAVSSVSWSYTQS